MASGLGAGVEAARLVDEPVLAEIPPRRRGIWVVLRIGVLQVVVAVRPRETHDLPTQSTKGDADDHTTPAAMSAGQTRGGRRIGPHSRTHRQCRGREVT